MGDDLLYLGANIYYWGEAEQRYLLLCAVRPLVHEARALKLAQGFWYCRFDARGPHIFILFRTVRENHDRLRKFLEKEIGTFLLNSPSDVKLSPQDVERRHQECRGKHLCCVDTKTGMAENNSVELFAHGPDEYPLWLAQGMASAGEFWAKLDELVVWTFESLQTGGLHAATRWLAAVDHSLGQMGLPAQDYWRFHASTLIPGLQQRVAGMAVPQVREMLDSALTRQHDRVLSELWHEGPGLGFDVPSFMSCVLAEDGRTQDHRFHVLREVNHHVLGQFGHPVRLQIPMVLYAWKRSLLPNEAGAGHLKPAQSRRENDGSTVPLQIK